MASPLTPGQQTFVSRLSQKTGLNPGVLTAWVLAEESSSAAQSRQAQGNHNWLNIGWTDSGQFGTKANVWANPASAADATAAWMKGQYAPPGYGHAAGSIQRILSTAGKSPSAQIAAIAGSGWASSGYNGGNTLRSLYGQYGGIAPKVAAVAAGRAAPQAPKGPGSTSVATSNTQPGAPLISTSFTGGQPDWTQAGVSALMASANKPINTSGKVSGGSLLKNLVNAASYFTPASTANTQETPTTKTTTTLTDVATAAAGGTKVPMSRAISAANEIAGHKYNYEWGGGHNATFAPTHGEGHGSGVGTGYDCSGAISAILHAAGKVSTPMVASEFMNYGSPGPGGRNDITIYASPTHVFAYIPGKGYFGTSGQNSGGGAGFFKTADTSGFTVRHVRLA